MFTGLINGIATIISIKKKKKIHIYTVKLPYILCENLKIGASIAHNGCCLTVKNIDKCNIICDVIEETLKTTNLGMLSIGDKINVERSVKYGDEIGGHIVSGHIINTVKIYEVSKLEDNYILWLKFKNIDLMKYIFYKGFVCIDGISLTVGNIINDRFCVYLIPQTLLDTTIGNKKKGDILNIEIDFYTQTIVDTTEKIIKKDMKNLFDS